MRYRRCAIILAMAGALWALEGAGPVTALADEQAQLVTASFILGQNQAEGRWYWLEQDGNLHKGWLRTEGRSYYMDENGAMVTGWREVDGEWYYFHEDGGMNLGELILDNGKYELSSQGALVSAGWVGSMGGGAYDAGCYDNMTQDLFDQLDEKKKDLYFEEYPDREDGYDGDMHRVYDRYAGFQMDMTLSKAAGHRLDGAMAGGYADDRIPDEGIVNDYLSFTNYRRNASCLELYVRDCDDALEAFDKIKEKLDKRFQSITNRKYSLEYYRRLGIAHREKDGKQYLMVILIR